MRKVMVLHETGWTEIVDFEETLEFYYKHLECRMIDIVRPYALIKKSHECKKFILIVDDEALLKSNPKINAFATLAYGSTICGKAILAKEEYAEDDIITVGLTREDVELFDETILDILDDIEYNKYNE